MAHQHHQRAAGSLHRRGELVPRQVREVITTTITRPHTTATLTATVVRPRPTTVDTTTRVSSTTSIVSRSSVSSSVVSTTSVPITSATPSSVSVVSTSTSTTLKPPPTSRSTRAVVTSVRTTSVQASSTAAAAASSTSTKSIGTIVGMVAGIVAGFLVIGIIAAFVVRRFRKKAAVRDAFSPDKFRRSAYILDDPKEPPHTPRPPSMIERRVAQGLPPPPSSAYPYSDSASQYGSEHGFAPQFEGGAQSQYGAAPAPAPYGAPNPYGAPPIPYAGQNPYSQYSDSLYGGTGYGSGAGVGSFASYGAYTQQHPQQFSGNPQHQHQQHPHIANQQQSQRAAFGPGQVLAPPMGRAASTRSDGMHSNIPNPFADQQQQQFSAPPSPSTTSSSSHARVPMLPAKPTAFLTRQPTQNGGAPPAYSDDGTYTNIKRDVKVAPIVMSVEGTSSSVSILESAPAPAPVPTAAPTAAETASATGNRNRPTSAYTVYDPNDAYGGI